MKTAQIAGESYISVSQASEMLGYSRDYVGQLCRAGSLTCKRSSGQWFVLESNVRARTNKAQDNNISISVEKAQIKPEPHTTVHKIKTGNVRDDVLVFDGEEYVTSARAAELTGYAQDYIGELARTKEVRARKVGRHWLVHKKEVIDHKKSKDVLLARVQSQSAGFSNSTIDDMPSSKAIEITTKYFTEEAPTLPRTLGSSADHTGTPPKSSNMSVTMTAPSVLQDDFGPAAQYFPHIGTDSYKVPIKVSHTPSTQVEHEPVKQDVHQNAYKKSISDIREYTYEGNSVQEKRNIGTGAKLRLSERNSIGIGGFFILVLLCALILVVYVYRANIIAVAEGLYGEVHDSGWYATVSNFVPGRSIEYQSY
jgi:excisionase family DNA binding protein